MDYYYAYSNEGKVTPNENDFYAYTIGDYANSKIYKWTGSTYDEVEAEYAKAILYSVGHPEDIVSPDLMEQDISDKLIYDSDI